MFFFFFFFFFFFLSGGGGGEIESETGYFAFLCFVACVLFIVVCLLFLLGSLVSDVLSLWLFPDIFLTILLWQTEQLNSGNVSSQ